MQTFFPNLITSLGQYIVTYSNSGPETWRAKNSALSKHDEFLWQSQEYVQDTDIQHKSKIVRKSECVWDIFDPKVQ